MWQNKFDTLYFNGCSFTEGGGFEDGKYWLKNAYKEKYNFLYKNEKDVCYPTIIQKKFPNIKVINEAKSGSGSERIIRKVYEYVLKNGLEKSQKTLFILEIPSAINRLDIYSNQYNKYLVANVTYNQKNTIEDTQTTLNWIYGPQLEEEYRNKTRQLIKEFSKYFVHPIEYEKRVAYEFLGLFSYLEKNNISFLVEYSRYFDDNVFIEFNKFFKNFTKEYMFDIEINGKRYNNIVGMGGSEKCLICDEVGSDISVDGHPGYRAHQLWADGIIDFLNKKYI